MNLNYQDYKTARFWIREKNRSTRCLLCPIKCRLIPSKVGVCEGKMNIDGRLYAINYGLTTSLNIDPIEKKPLYHFMPGSKTLSIGPNGCNINCSFCQNYHISQMKSETLKLSAEAIVEKAISENIESISYTYSEPLIWYEFVYDTAKIVKKNNLGNILVTNGFIEEKPLLKLLPFIDAFNVDLKSFDNNFYKKVCKGSLLPVIRSIKNIHKAGVHLEITTLLIENLNSDSDNIKNIVDFIANIDPDIPFHISRYHPDYKMQLPPTRRQTILNAAKIAEKKLNFVYVGNIRIDDYIKTVCPECKKLLIDRNYYRNNLVNHTLNGQCPDCKKRKFIITKFH